MADKPLTLLMERAAGWPEDMQAELVEAMVEIERKHVGVYRLSEDERAAIEKSLEEVRRGELASDEEVAALFKRFRG